MSVSARTGAICALSVAAALLAVPAAAQTASGHPHGTPRPSAAPVLPQSLALARQGTAAALRSWPGAVTGVARDRRGAPLRDVCVQARGPSGMSMTRTSGSGRYVLPGLAAGPYLVRYGACPRPGHSVADLGLIMPSPGRERHVFVRGGGQLTRTPPVTVRPAGSLVPAGADRRVILRADRRRSAAGLGGVAGRVTDTAGHPLRGICAEVHFSGGYLGISTNRWGRYDTGPGSLPAGRYTVEFLASCDSPATGGGPNWAPQWYRQKQSQSAANPVLVRAGRITRGIDGALRAGGQVTGVVTGRFGKPVTGACVGLFTRAGQLLDVAKTTRSGYRIGALAAGQYKVLFDPGCGNASSYLPQWWPGKADFASAGLLRVRLGQLRRHVNAALVQGGTMTGVVRLANSKGHLLGGICVFADLGSDPFGPGFSATTNRSSRYTITGMPAGRYAVSFGAVGCGNNGNYVFLNLPRAVRVSDGRTTAGVNGYLQPGGIVTGTVTDTHGSPLRGICVGLSSGYFAATSKDGTYLVNQLPAGHPSVAFSGGCGNPGSYAPQWWDSQANFGAAQTLAITPGKLITGIDARMEPGAAITGSVTSTSGRKLGGFCVGVDTPADIQLFGGYPLGAQVQTNGGGGYQVANLAPGQYAVEFFSGCSFGPNFAAQWFRGQAAFATTDLVNVAAGQTLTGISAVLSPGGTISGTISDAHGRTIGQGCGTATATNRRTGFTAPARSFGPGSNYAIPGLPAGSYTVQLASQCGFPGGLVYASQWYNRRDSASQADPVRVTADRTTRSVDALLNQGGSIAGRVTSKATGRPLAGICVSAYNTDSSGFGATNRTGAYRVPGLNPGSYHVEFLPCSRAVAGLADLLLARSIRVTTGRTTTGVDAALLSGGGIAGTIKAGSSPAAAAGLCVDALPVGAGPTAIEGFGTTGPHGRYVIGNLPPGRYKVLLGDPACAFAPQGLAPRWFDGQATESAATIVRVTAGSVTHGIGATLLPDGTISGTVTGPAPGHQPLAGICVMAIPGAPAVNPVLAVSAGDGSYRLPGLLPGRYTVEFQAGCGATGYATQWWQDATSAGSATPVTVSAAATVSGINAALRR